MRHVKSWFDARVENGIDGTEEKRVYLTTDDSSVFKEATKRLFEK